MAYGNTSVSGLLRSARAAADKIDSYNDALAAYQYDISAKTEQDYASYKGYLGKRLSSGSIAPDKALSLTKTMDTANRSFTSNEINRQSALINQGRGNNTDKYNRIVQLQQAAINNGDANLAQSLDQRLASLYDTIQTENEAAQKKASAQYQKDLKDAYTKGDPNAVGPNGEILDPKGLGVNQVNGALKQLEDAFNKGSIGSAAYQSHKGALLSQKSQIQQQASQDNRLDDNSQFSNDFYSTINSSDFKNFASPGAQQAVQNGLVPREIKIDSNGNRSLSDRPVAGHDAAGNPVYATNTVSGSTDGSSAFHFNRADSTKQGASISPYGVGVASVIPAKGTVQTPDKAKELKAGNLNYVDPVTGKVVYVQQSTDGTFQHQLALPDGSSPFNSKTNGSPSGFTKVMEHLPDFGDVVHAVGHGLSALHNPLHAAIAAFGAPPPSQQAAHANIPVASTPTVLSAIKARTPIIPAIKSNATNAPLKNVAIPQSAYGTAFGLIHTYRVDPNNKTTGYNGAANYLKSQGIDIGRGAVGEVALNRYFNAAGFEDYQKGLQNEGKYNAANFQ